VGRHRGVDGSGGRVVLVVLVYGRESGAVDLGLGRGVRMVDEAGGGILGVGHCMECVGGWKGGRWRKRVKARNMPCGCLE
jgi:hypothetical protein